MRNLMEIYEMMDKGMNNEALAAAKQTVKMIDKKTDEYLNWLNALGYIYCNLENYLSAFNVYDEYIKRSEQRRDYENLHIGFHQKAMVYRLNKQYLEGLNCINREKEIISEYFTGDQLKISVNEYEHGYILYLMDRIEDAYIHMKQCLECALETDDLTAQACAYRGLAEICCKKAEAKTANKYFEKAYDLFIKAGDAIGAEEVAQIRKNKNL